jgi:hypothetical protein
MTIYLEQAAAAELLDDAITNGVTVTEQVRRHISVGHSVEAIKAAGGRVLVERATGEVSVLDFDV